jgi:hypothetical protein
VGDLSALTCVNLNPEVAFGRSRNQLRPELTFLRLGDTSGFYLSLVGCSRHAEPPSASPAKPSTEIFAMYSRPLRSAIALACAMQVAAFNAGAPALSTSLARPGTSAGVTPLQLRSPAVAQRRTTVVGGLQMGQFP